MRSRFNWPTGLTFYFKSLKRADQYKERCERVYIFLRIMGKMEGLMFYGILCCTDIFLSVLTLLPLRCCVTIIKFILWPLRRLFLGPRKFIHQSQVMDLARVALVLITCFCSFSPLLYWNTSGKFQTSKISNFSRISNFSNVSRTSKFSKI